jgi:hypothetical protein
LLRGGGYVVAFPFLTSLAARSRAAAATPPRRLILWYQPDGAGPGRRDHFYPKGDETTFTMNRITAKLEPIRQDLVFIRGVDNTSSPSTGNEAHGSHMRSCLTSGEANSIDQVIAERLNPPTPFKTLEIGVASDSGAKQSQIAYRGGRGLAPQEDPNKVFARLFGEKRDSPQGQDDLLRLHRRRKSILDGVKDELTRLEATAGSEDRKVIDAHATTIRELELSLDRLNKAMPPATCGAPSVNLSGLSGQTRFRGSWDTPGGTVPNLEKIAPVQHELLTLAMKCDLTRVATVSYLRSNSGQTYPFLPITNKTVMNHGFAHGWSTRKDGESDFVTIMQWRCEMFRDLVDRFRNTPEGTGTMLDNSLIVWVSDYANGDHASRDVPYTVAGRGGGTVRSGRLLNRPGQPHARLLISLAEAMGVRLDKFGAGQGGLPGLLG